MPGGWDEQLCAESRERPSLVKLRAQEVGVRETTGGEEWGGGRGGARRTGVADECTISLGNKS